MLLVDVPEMGDNMIYVPDLPRNIKIFLKDEYRAFQMSDTTQRY